MASESRSELSVLRRLKRLSQRVVPRISQQLDERLEGALGYLDGLNRSLAERAIPRERRERVRQRSEQAASSRSTRLRVVPRDTD